MTNTTAIETAAKALAAAMTTAGFDPAAVRVESHTDNTDCYASISGWRTVSEDDALAERAAEWLLRWCERRKMEGTATSQWMGLTVSSRSLYTRQLHGLRRGWMVVFGWYSIGD